MAKLSSGTLEAIRNFGKEGMLTGSGQGMAPVTPAQTFGGGFGDGFKKMLGALMPETEFRNSTEKYKDELAKLGTVDTDEEQTQLLKLNLQLAADRGNRAEIAQAAKAIQVHEANLRQKRVDEDAFKVAENEQAITSILFKSNDPYGAATRQEIGQFALENKVTAQAVTNAYEALESTLGTSNDPQNFSRIGVVQDKNGVEFSVTQNKSKPTELTYSRIGPSPEDWEGGEYSSPIGKPEEIDFVSTTTGLTGKETQVGRINLANKQDALRKEAEKLTTFRNIKQANRDEALTVAKTITQATDMLTILDELERAGANTAGLTQKALLALERTFGISDPTTINLQLFDSKSKNMIKISLQGFTNPTEGERDFAKLINPRIDASTATNRALLNDILKYAKLARSRIDHVLNFRDEAGSLDAYDDYLLKEKLATEASKRGSGNFRAPARN
tara:strand:+ start:1538 stop:2875 length:1338 start_codon:yes stop_codon:yes gene_type:complete